MQLVVARHLRRRWPEAQIAIHAPHPEDEHGLYEEYEVVSCSRRKPWRAMRLALRAALWRASGARSPLPPELRSYRDASLVIHLSGDGLTETFGWRCPVSHTVPLLLARLVGTPFCLLGQTIGPFGRLAPWFRRMLRGAVLITARDEETMRYLSTWNLTCPVELTADLAFLLEPATARDAAHHLTRAGAYEASRPLLGVTPSNLHNIRGIRDAPGRTAPEGIHETIAHACRALAERTGAQIAVIPHVFGPGPDYDDRHAAEKLAAHLGDTTASLTIRDPLAPGELKAIIGRCDLFIGMRMHSVIAAVSQAVPTIAVAYSPKARHLMHRLGVSRFALDAGTLRSSDLTALSSELWHDRATIRDSLRRRLDSDVLPAARRNLDLLEEHAVRIAGQSPS